MKDVALVSLDCVDGIVRRYLRVEGNKPLNTGRDKFTRWIEARENVPAVVSLIQEYRVAYVPPEPPPPRPTGPMRTQMSVAA